MKIRFWMVCILFCTLAVFGPGKLKSDTIDDNIFSVDQSVRDLIESIDEEKNAAKRRVYASAILSYSMGTPEEIHDKTILLISELLSNADDVVRADAAAALGYLRERAKIAVPQLLAALPQTDCLEGSINSSGAIRKALERIGEPAPPRNCFKKTK